MAQLELSGEARNAHRDVPRAIATVPGSHLAHGWAGIDFNSPFAQLAVVLGAAFLLLLPSWHDIIKATSELGLFIYSITMVCQAALRIAEPARETPWFRGTSALAPVGSTSEAALQTPADFR